MRVKGLRRGATWYRRSDGKAFQISGMAFCLMMADSIPGTRGGASESVKLTLAEFKKQFTEVKR